MLSFLQKPKQSFHSVKSRVFCQPYGFRDMECFILRLYNLYIPQSARLPDEPFFVTGIFDVAAEYKDTVIAQCIQKKG